MHKCWFMPRERSKQSARSFSNLVTSRFFVFSHFQSSFTWRDLSGWRDAESFSAGSIIDGLRSADWSIVRSLLERRKKKMSGEEKRKRGSSKSVVTVELKRRGVMFSHSLAQGRERWRRFSRVEGLLTYWLSCGYRPIYLRSIDWHSLALTPYGTNTISVNSVVQHSMQVKRKRNGKEEYAECINAYWTFITSKLRQPMKPDEYVENAWSIFLRN